LRFQISKAVGNNYLGSTDTDVNTRNDLNTLTLVIIRKNGTIECNHMYPVSAIKRIRATEIIIPGEKNQSI